MVQLTITHLTIPHLQVILFMISTTVGFILMSISPYTHRFGAPSLMNLSFTSTSPHRTPARASNFQNVFIPNPSLRIPFSGNHAPLSLNSQLTHTNATFRIWHSNTVTTFETNSYPQQHHFQVHSATVQQQRHTVISVRLL